MTRCTSANASARCWWRRTRPRRRRSSRRWPSSSKLRTQKLGDILLTKQIVSAEELEQAIIEQARMPMVRIGEALIALGFINNAQLEVALSQQREDRSVPLGELLVRRGLVSRADLQTALARKMGYPLVDVTQFAAETEALARLPFAVASRLPALPLLLRGGRLIVAVEDPSRPEVLDDIEFASQTKVVPVLARASLLPAAIAKAYERIGVNVGGTEARRAGASSTPKKPASCWPRWSSSSPATAAIATRRRSSSPTTRWCG